jgi:hypothetical protein
MQAFFQLTMDSLVYIIAAIIVAWVAFGARPTTTAIHKNNSENKALIENIWTPDEKDRNYAIYVVFKQVWPFSELTNDAAELHGRVLDGIVQLVIETASKSRKEEGDGPLSFGAISDAVANVFNKQAPILGGHIIQEMEKAILRLKMKGEDHPHVTFIPWKVYRGVADDSAAVGLACLKEFLCASILEASGQKADLQSVKAQYNPITPIEIKRAIEEDPEMKSVLGYFLIGDNKH